MASPDCLGLMAVMEAAPVVATASDDDNNLVGEPADSPAVYYDSVVHRTVQSVGAVEPFTLDLSLTKCAVCQDIASGVHYGVPACEGCKGFFRRIVSSCNLGGACGHTVPLEITPQTRNTCQWCRLKKCCAVNMGRQRSKLGRRAKARESAGQAANSAIEQQFDQLASDGLPTFSEIPLPGSTGGGGASNSSAWSINAITDSHLLLYIEQKRREFEVQLGRRSSSGSNNGPGSRTYQRQAQYEEFSPPAPSSSMAPPPLKRQRLLRPPQQPDSAGSSAGHPVAKQPARCLNMLYRLSPASSALHHSQHQQQSQTRDYFHLDQQQQPPPGRAPKKLWLEKSQLISTDEVSSESLGQVCQRLVGPLLCPTLEAFVRQVSLNERLTRILLTSVEKFSPHWPPQRLSVSSQFVHANGEVTSSQLIADNIDLILLGHRRSFHFSPERMAQFRAERLQMTREPLPDEEPVVLSRLLACMPSLLSRVVAFTQSIFGDSGTDDAAAAAAAEASQEPPKPPWLENCSEVICPADKRRLLLSHCSQLLAMRFCFSLVKRLEGYIIDPTMNFRLTRRFLQSARHPMLSKLFTKFFELSTKWDQLSITDNELAFLSAFCLTSPYIGIQCPESVFVNLDSLISTHLSIAGLFWTHLCNEETNRHGWSPSVLQQSHELRLSVRLAAIKRLFHLTEVFTPLLDINGLGGDTSATIQCLIDRIASSPLADISPTGMDFNVDLLLPNGPAGRHFREFSQQQQQHREQRPPVESSGQDEQLSSPSASYEGNVW